LEEVLGLTFGLALLGAQRLEAVDNVGKLFLTFKRDMRDRKLS